MHNELKVDYAKGILREFVPKIDTALEAFWNEEIAKLKLSSEDLQKLGTHILEHSKEHNLRTAKRLRGAFLYYAYRMFKDDKEEEIMKAALSIELVHTALLMHDDFMDRDDTRRGAPTTHEFYRQYHHDNLIVGDSVHFGNALAINVGDVVLTAGYRQILYCDFDMQLKMKAFEIMFNGIIETGYGQAYDIFLESKGNGTEENVISLHHAKTSIYTYQTPLIIGATLAGASDDELLLLKEYAVPGGIAFQLQDDVLGLYGNTEKTGKPAHADLREGKKTLLILKALEMGNVTQVRKIMEIWGNHNIKDSDAEVVRQIVRETGALEYSKQVAMRFARDSQVVVAKMRERGWNSEVVDFLDGVAEYMAVGRDV